MTDIRNTAHVLMINRRYFAYFSEHQTIIATYLAGAKLFLPDDPDINKVEKILIHKGHKPVRCTVELNLLDAFNISTNDTTKNK